MEHAQPITITSPTDDDDFVRLPGLFRRWELEQVFEPGTDFHLEEAGNASDGTPLFAVYRRDAIGPPDPVDPPLPDYGADPAPGPLAACATIPTLDALQREVAARWGSSAYGPAYLERRDPQRDAHHALLHVTKATGKLAGLLDDLDHAPGVVHAATIAREDAARYLGDLVICAARVASEWPGAAIDLLAAVEARLAEKLPAKAGGATK